MRTAAFATLATGACAVLGPLLGLGCASERDGERLGARVREAFPAHAARALGQGAKIEGALVEAGDSFDLPEPRGGLSARVFRDTSRGVELRAAGVVVTVREDGALGEVARDGLAAAHARRGGASFWSGSERGLEEWIHLEAGRAFAGRAAVSFRVEGAPLTSAGDVVEIDDPAGVPRLRVVAPEAFTASGHAVPVHLTARGDRLELEVDARGEEVLVDPAFYPTGFMTWPREAPGALMPGGKVLVAGGMKLLGAPADTRRTAEVYDSATGVFSLVASSAVGRSDHTATSLDDGRVLVAGGVLSGTTTAQGTAEIFDPAAGAWTPTFPLVMARSSHTATLLPDGRVLVVGGRDSAGVITASVELVSPGSAAGGPLASSQMGPTLTMARAGHTATLVAGGKVLVVGGDAFTGKTAELFDPVASTWSVTGSLFSARSTHAAVKLADGRVLVSGGSQSSAAVAEIYDPAKGTWTLTSSSVEQRDYPAGALLPSGLALVVGGTVNAIQLSLALAYDATTDTWTTLTPLPQGRSHPAAVSLPNGLLLLAGGAGDLDALASAELYGKGVLGDTCAASSDCSSGHCAHGYCCESACDGPCATCGLIPGACVAAPAGSPGSPTCAPFACNGLLSTCPTGCTEDSQCPTTSFCRADGSCQPKLARGSLCNPAADCSANGCQECQTGHCADGVCCESECADQCSACDVVHNEGLCIPVKGAPHGSRPSCAGASGDDPCSATACNGDTVGGCVALAGAEVTCREGSCEGGVETLPARCDGTGVCPTAVETQPCAPFICGVGACLELCTSDGDCANGAQCATANGQCVEGATCLNQSTIVVPPDHQTDCSPYRCDQGTCLTACDSGQDCASGFVCSSLGVCGMAAGGGDGGGSVGHVAEAKSGCATSSSPAGGGEQAGFLALSVAFALGARRRGVAAEGVSLRR